MGPGFRQDDVGAVPAPHWPPRYLPCAGIHGQI